MKKVVSIRLEQEKVDTIQEMNLDKREIFERGLDIILGEYNKVARTRIDSLRIKRMDIKNRLESELEILDREINTLSVEIQANSSRVLELKTTYMKWIKDRSFRIRRMDHAENPMSWVRERAMDHPYLLDPFFQEQGINVTSAEILEIMEGK